MERNKLVVIDMLATDVVLALTMFFGLLRLRGEGTGMFGLARLLWKQVRNQQFFVAQLRLAFLTYILFARALSGSFLTQEWRSLQR
jgi:hypothetical protein